MNEFGSVAPPLRQPADRVRPAVLELFDNVGLYNVDGIPLFATKISEYDSAGGLRLEPYERGDSPSRDSSDFPFNATLFDYLRKNYGGALHLLEELRQSYADTKTDYSEMTGEDTMTVYHMGVQLPQFLIWRQDNPYKNGEIPREATVLRQALLGVGTVLLDLPVESLPDLDGEDIAQKAEERGDLVGGPTNTEIPRMVCPAAPAMIAGLGQALLHGNPERVSDNSLLEEFSIDVVRLRDFVSFIKLYGERRDELHSAVQALANDSASIKADFSFGPPKTKAERYDELMQAFCDFMNEKSGDVYQALGRTDTPRPMHLERLYAKDGDLRRARMLFGA